MKKLRVSLHSLDITVQLFEQPVLSDDYERITIRNFQHHSLYIISYEPPGCVPRTGIGSVLKCGASRRFQRH